ncbi:NAD(P)-binding Rossmann-fold superfamily protein [Abeliophyllum distichum]|uniref:NAD(P)-binding Rossmann-fold superfamily protein n=1 Tax=Abeliophyllum distichum TaxID=126358 RepID=A0ABD1UQQ3_9LAMI
MTVKNIGGIEIWIQVRSNARSGLVVKPCGYHQLNAVAVLCRTLSTMTTKEAQLNHAAAAQPIFISTPILHSFITHKSLIHHLQSTLPTLSPTIHSPIRHAHQTSPSSSLLLMPSWSLSPSLPYVGIKLVTYYPNNSTLNLPGVQASYVLFNSLTGQPLASIDATELTLYRTSCVSALASFYLSREDSETLLMIGSGSLAPHLIKAHLSVRPKVKKVIIWNRTEEKARNLVEKMSNEGCFEGVCFESSGFLEEVVKVVDIISCATNSEIPLVKGVDLKAGTHLDLVGSFKHSMKECDDEAIRRGRVFVDNEAAMTEAGELVGAFERGVITKDEIAGDLVGLIKGEKPERKNSKEITVFKSVGSAVVDLLSAQLVYENYIKSEQ